MLLFKHQFRICFAVALLLAFGAESFCQEVPNDNARAIVDLKQRLEKDELATAAVKTEIASQIQLAESNFAKAEELKKRVVADQAATASVTDRSAAFIAELEKIKGTVAKTIDEKTSLEQIELDLAAQKKTVDQLKLDLAQNEQEESRRTSRRQYIRSQIDVNAKLLADLDVELSAIAPEDHSLQTEPKRILLISNRAFYEAEKLSLAAEQNRFDTAEKANFLRNQRDLLTLQLNQSQTILAALEESQTAKRKTKADASALSAVKELAEVKRLNPLLAKSYETNATLAKRVQEVEAEAKVGKEKLDKITARLLKLQTQASETRKRVTTIGLTGSVGAMLRKQKVELPDTHLSYSDANAIKERMEKIQYEKFDTDQERVELSAEVILAEIESDPELIRTAVEKKFGAKFEQEYEKNKTALIEELKEGSVDELVTGRRQHLDALSKSLDRLFDEVLADTEFNDRKLAKQSTEFREYINERILWIRSNNVLFSQFELDETEATALSPAKWSDFAKNVWRSIVGSPGWFGVTSFLILLLFCLKPRFRREIDAMGVVAARGSCDSFWPTARAFV